MVHKSKIAWEILIANQSLCVINQTDWRRTLASGIRESHGVGTVPGNEKNTARKVISRRIRIVSSFPDGSSPYGKAGRGKSHLSSVTA